MRKYLKYKGVEVNAFGIPTFLLNKDKIIKTGTPGRKYYQYRCFEFNYKVGSLRDLVVMYDFYKDKTKERNWFRRHLQKFGYIMIQKSAWVGPSPLPRGFLNYVKSIGLSNQIVTLKLAKPYIKGDRNI